MLNALKDDILKVTIENVHINAMRLQKLQHTMVATVDRIEV